MPVYPVYDSETDSLVYHVVPESQTDRAGSAPDIVSEIESSASGMTIQSDGLPEYFIQCHGQQQPASENAVRWFPTDDTKRYILRHIVNKHVYGHNYLGPVREMLRSEPGADKSYHVLEIGTRDGTWIQEMSTEFPHVQFRSLDIAPIMAHAMRPNIAFEVYDIMEGLLLEDNSQDIVFINMATELVKDYRALLLEVHRVLRPGGLIHMREFVPGLWDSQDDSKPARETNPIGCHMFDLFRSAISKLGVDPNMCEKLPIWLAPSWYMWKDSNQDSGFERIHTVIKTCPHYPHDGYPCSTKLGPRFGALVRHLVVLSTRDSFGLLRDAGLSVEEANHLIESTIQEMKDPEKCSLIKLYTVYAIKRG